MDLPDIAANTPLWLALVTTFVAAISGAILGRTPGKVHYDIVGIVVFAFFLGLGGGITRDVLLGNLPPLALRSPWYILAVLAAVVLVLLVGRWIPVDGWIFTILDALALALYAVIAAQMAIEFGLPDIGAIAVGFLAAIAGGVIVAVLRGEVPAILRPGEPYAILALLGATAYVLLDEFSPAVAAFVCIGTVVALRLITLKWNVRTRGLRPIQQGAAAESSQNPNTGTASPEPPPV